MKYLKVFFILTLISCQESKDLPPTLMVDPEKLVDAKKELENGDKELQAALGELKSRADKALDGGVFSVMDKTSIPVSGNKHDYTSIGVYWWPDSAREDYLPYIRKDGNINPEVYSNRFDWTSRVKFFDNLEALAWTYYYTEEDSYASHAAKLARVWFIDENTRMNPNLNCSQAIPGRNEGRYIGIIDFREIGEVLDAISLISRSPHWTEKDQKALEAWLEDYLEWLRTHEFGIDESNQRNNHGTWYDVQVAYLALYLDKETMAREIIDSAKYKRIDTQIDSVGGMQWELRRTRSFHYTLMNTDALLQLVGYGRQVGIDLMTYESPWGGSIRKCVDFWVPYLDPSEAWPYEQIMPMYEEGNLETIIWNLRRAYYYTGDDVYLDYLNQLPKDLLQSSVVDLMFPEIKVK